MTTISSRRDFIPHNFDPVADSDPGAQAVERLSRASGSGRGGTHRGHGHGHGHGHDQNHTPDTTRPPSQNHTPSRPSDSVGSTNGTANSNVVKPVPKKGQDVDKEGWPLNNLKQRVDLDGNAIDIKGRRINDKNHLVNDKNQTINEKGRWINDKGQTLNTLGKPVDEKNRLIDSQNRLINHNGRLVDEHKRLIDKDGKRVDREGYLIDIVRRPLDKDGKVARSKESAVQGNNEPHPQLKGMTNSLKKKPSADPSAVPAAPSIDESAKKASKTNDLVKKGWIPSAPEVSKTLILGMVDGAGGALAAFPINLAESAASSAVSGSIEDKYLPKPLDTSTKAPTPSGSDGAVAPESEADKAKREKQAAQNSALNNLQVSVFETNSALDKLTNGKIDLELAPGTGWPDDPIGRLDKLEALLDDMEPKARDLKERHRVYYEVPELPESSPAPGADGIDARIKALEERLGNIQELRESVEAKINKKAGKP